MGTTKLVLFATVLAVGLAGLAGCKKDSAGTGPDPVVVPRAGLWTGARASFYVSADGSKLTANGSTLMYQGKPCAILVTWSGGTAAFLQESAIVGGKISYMSSPETYFTGNFASSTAANGVSRITATVSEATWSAAAGQ